MAYPTTPRPVDVQDTPFTWPSVKTEFEAGYRQVRNLIDCEIRGFALEYDGLTDAELASLHTFWQSRKGQALTFQFEHPVTGEVTQCRFATNTWEPERVSALGDGWNRIKLVLEEART
ncbi:MAG: hypothetical protein ACM3UP_00610 [Methanocella sp.]